MQDCKTWATQEAGATGLKVQGPDSKSKSKKKAADIAQW